MKDENIKSNPEELKETAADAVGVSEDAVAAAFDKTAQYTDNALSDELEQLAETFRNELKKAQAMSEEELVKNGIVIQEYEDEDGAIPPEELCECCGERRKDNSRGENYEYCSECREAMCRYPISVPSLIVVIAVVFAAVVSVMNFAVDFVKYNTICEADKYLSEGKLDSAISAYDGAISAFEDEGVKPKWIYLDVADILYRSMPNGVSSMSQIINVIDSALSDTELNIPIYGPYKNMREEVLTLYGTMQKFYSVVNKEEYAELTADNTELYEQAMTEIGAIIDEEITLTSSDGKTSYNVKSSEAMVRFCQYMYAYTAGKYDDSYQYMKRVAELEPGYLWLYAYELGLVELQKGNADYAEELAQALYANNTEGAESYSLYSSIYRMTGKAEKAVEWAEKGISSTESNAELCRLKAMAFVAQGDYESAKKAVDEGIALNKYGLIYFTAIVIENELGNTDTVEEYKKTLEEQGIELSQKMKDYFDGKIPADKLFTEGTGDVE